MKIAILDDTYGVVRTLPSARLVAGHELSVWQDHTKDVELLAQRLADAEVLMLLRERTPIPRALLERLPRLRLITLNGVTPHIDLPACTQLGIAVSTHSYVSTATAELTWALMLMSLRRLPSEIDSLKQGRWQCAGMGQGLRGKCLGIWGYGQIGQQVAQFGRVFGMEVGVFSRESGLAKARADGFETFRDKPALLAHSDVLSLHLRLTPQTQACLSYADLCSMKPGSLLVNTSRARLIEDGALVRALAQGRPAMAAVDVFEEEPMRDTDHPLLHMDNVICTPHLGYVELNQYDGMYRDQFERMLAFFDGRPQHIVNPEVLARLRAPAWASVPLNRQGEST